MIMRYVERNEWPALLGSATVLVTTAWAVGATLAAPNRLEARARADLRTWVLAIHQYQDDNNGGLPLHGYAVGYGAPRKLEGWPSDGHRDADDPCVDPRGEYDYVPYYRMLRFVSMFDGMHHWDPNRDPVVMAPGCRATREYPDLIYRRREGTDVCPLTTKQLAAWLDGRIDWSPSILGFQMEFATNGGLRMTREIEP